MIPAVATSMSTRPQGKRRSPAATTPDLSDQSFGTKQNGSDIRKLISLPLFMQLSPQLLDSIGRDGVIRTHDPLHPMQVRYQAALRPD